MKRALDSLLDNIVEYNEETHHDSDCNIQTQQVTNSFNFPTVVAIYNITYKVSNYNIFYESRGKTLLSCKINNVECVAKKTKQHEGVKSILSLYLPSECPEYCFTLKGLCLGTIFKNEQVDQIDVFRFVEDLLCTLVLLESGNITHNDIKPDNIVLYEGHWFLIDYELSKQFKFKCGKYFDRSNGKLRCERFSRGYRPPERINSKIVSPKSDIYSLGLVILEILHKKRLTSLENPIQVQQYLQDEILSNASQRDNCLLNEILPQMLIQQSNKRPTPTVLLTNLREEARDNLDNYSFDFSKTLSFFNNIDHFRNKLFTINLPDS